MSSLLENNITNLQEILQKLDTLPDSVSGVNVQITTKSTFATTNNNGDFSVNCGFKPDVVFINQDKTSSVGYKYAAAIPFALYPDGTVIEVPLWKGSYNSGYVYDLYVQNTSNGFSGGVSVWTENWEEDSPPKGTTFNYIAIKYTA